MEKPKSTAQLKFRKKWAAELNQKRKAESAAKKQQLEKNRIEIAEMELKLQKLLFRQKYNKEMKRKWAAEMGNNF